MHVRIQRGERGSRPPLENHKKYHIIGDTVRLLIIVKKKMLSKNKQKHDNITFSYKLINKFIYK